MAAGKFASLPRNMPVNHQFPLASSMDLLSSKSPLVERRADAYQDVSIHGTLPRKKKGPPPIRSCDNFSHVGTLPHSRSPRHHSPLIQDVIQEQPLQDWKGEAFTFRDQHLLDPTLEYVKAFLEVKTALRETAAGAALGLMAPSLSLKTAIVWGVQQKSCVSASCLATRNV